MNPLASSLVLAGILVLPACGVSSNPAEGAPAGGLKASAARGRGIYLRGESPSGERIVAVLEEQQVEVPATAMPCASCHGRDGKGRPEGGVVPAPLVWRQLTRPFERTDDRRRPAYDERSFIRAVTLGVDSGGKTLHSVMPRYRLSHADAQDLLAYIQQLGHHLDPGLTENRIRLATLVPDGPEGEAIRQLLEARLRQVNREGGLYGRQLELSAIAYSEGSIGRIELLERRLAEEPAFALLAPSFGEEAAPVADFAESREIPVLTPFATQPVKNTASNRYLFYLYGGALEQSRALVELAARNPGPRTVIVYPKAEEAGARLRVVVDQARRSGLKAELLELAEPTQELSWALDTGRLLVVGAPPFASEVVNRAVRSDWHGEIWLAGDDAATMPGLASSGFRGSLHVALPTLPALDHQPRGIENWQALADHYDLTREHRPLQYAALATTELLLEALRRAGRNLTRERLVEALEQLPPSSIGLTPTLHFGPSRRTGAVGGYMVRIDPRSGERRRISGWIEPR